MSSSMSATAADASMIKRFMASVRSSRKMQIVLLVVGLIALVLVGYFAFRYMRKRNDAPPPPPAYAPPPTAPLPYESAAPLPPQVRAQPPAAPAVQPSTPAPPKQPGPLDDEPYVQTDERMALERQAHGRRGYQEHPFDRPLVDCRPGKEKKLREEQQKNEERFESQARNAQLMAEQQRLAQQQQPPLSAQQQAVSVDEFASNPSAQAARQAQQQDPSIARGAFLGGNVTPGEAAARRQSQQQEAQAFLGSGDNDTPKRRDANAHAGIGQRITLNDPACRIPSTLNYTQVPPTEMGTHHGDDCLTPAQRLGQGGEYPSALAQPRVLIQRALQQDIQPGGSDGSLMPGQPGSMLRCVDEARQTNTDVVCYGDGNNPVASVNKGAFGQSGERLNVTGTYTPQLPVGLSG